MHVSVKQVQQLPVFHRETIPSEYLDQMGHMNIRYYLGIFDDAVWEFFASFGMDNDYFRTTHAGAFALQQYIRYLAEVRVNETVAIYTRVLARSEKRIHFMNFMVNETTNTLASTLEVLGSHADLKTRRTSPYPPDLAKRLDAQIARHSALDWLAPVCGVIKP